MKFLNTLLCILIISLWVLPVPVQAADPLAEFLFPWLKPPVGGVVDVGGVIPPYTREGDKVIYENDDVYLEASPAILTSSGWVTFRYKTKTFSDELDVVYGFNDNIQISRPKFLNPIAVRTKYNAVTSIKTATFEPVSIISSVTPKSYVKADVGDSLLNSKVAVVDCEVASPMMGIGKTTTTRQTQTIAYDTFDGKVYTYKYQAVDQVPYTVIEEGIDDIKSLITTSSFGSGGMNRWQSVYGGKKAYANQLNETRVWIDIPFAGTNKIDGKYLVGLKPSYLSISQAKSDGQLWLIDPWYNSSWGYKKSIGISSTTNQTNYQMKLNVHYGGLDADDVEATGIIHTPSASVGDFDDLRFTTSNETTLLDYWIESSTASTNATVWVEVDDISSANTTVIYMYYGNAGAAAGSSGADTFIQYKGAATADYDEADATPASSSLRYRASGRATATTHTSDWGMYSSVGGTSMLLVQSYSAGNFKVFYAYKTGAGSSVSEAPSFTKDTTYIIEILFLTGVSAKAYVDGDQIGTTITNVLHLPTVSMGLYCDAEAGTLAQDWAFVANYTANEPTWSSFGAEEAYLQPTPSTTTNNAANIQETTATFNATITAGSSLALRGFAWGTTSNVTTITNEVPPACYTSNWTESGSFSLGNFTYDKTGLTAGTAYYYRGYSYNATGYGWGSEVSFLTKPAAPTAVAATDGTSTTEVTVTWTKSTGATDYHVWRDAVDLGAAGDVDIFHDTGAGAPTVTGGTATASDGTFVAYVELSVAGESAANGATHTYKVVASNATGNSADSLTDTGYRGTTALTYAWQRTATDAVGGIYSAIAGGTTDPYNDTGAPSDGSGRWYRSVISMTGATSANTTDNRGYRSPTPTVSTTGSTGLGDTWATGGGNLVVTAPVVATQVGVDYGLTSAYGDSYVAVGTYSSGAFSVYISGLSAGTTYHYRAKAMVEGIWYYGGDSVFSTLGAATPFVSWGIGGGSDSPYIGSSNVTYQTFTTNTTAVPYSVTKINLMVKRVGLPGIVTASIRATTLPTTTTMSGTTITSSNSTGFAWGVTSNSTLPLLETPPASYLTNYTVASTNLAAGAFTYANPLAPSSLYYYRGYSNNVTGWFWSGETALYGTPAYPVGADIAAGTLDGATFGTTYSWYTFTMATEVCLASNTVYAIVLQCPDADVSNYVLWQAQAVGAYPGGNAGYSTDSGTTWTHNLPKDQLFEVWGNPCFTLSDAKVFSSYISTGDWLITCLYKNLYPPYYAQAKDVSSLFVIQLYDPATATVIAQTKCFEWGYKPGAIYIASSGTTHLQWGYGYRVRLYGLFTGNPYTEYVLQPTDYLGSDLTRLDSWVRSCASLMETYYNTSLTTYLTDRGVVLNSAGGVIFATDIPQLSVRRPNLFSIVSATTVPATGEYSQTYQDTLRWEVLMGPQLARTFTAVGNTVGVSGATIGSWLGFMIYALVALFCFRPGHAIAAMVVPVPILLIAFGTGLAELALMGILIAIAIVLFVWQAWFKGA